MAKSKRKLKEPASTEPKGDGFETRTTAPVDQPGQQGDTGEPPTSDGHTQLTDRQQGEATERQQQTRQERKPRSVLGIYLTDRRVQLIDDGNAGGIGIKLSYNDPAESPSEAVKQILREGDEKRPGFTYRGDLKEWRKRIGADADPRTAVAIRLDAERRVEAIGRQMSHEERIRQEREPGQKPDGQTPS